MNMSCSALLEEGRVNIPRDSMGNGKIATFPTGLPTSIQDAADPLPPVVPQHWVYQSSASQDFSSMTAPRLQNCLSVPLRVPIGSPRESVHNGELF